MATLTEKEITIEASGVNIDLLAEYSNGKLTDIYVTVDIDGHRLVGYGQGVRIYDGLKFTSFYGALLLAFHPEVVSKLEAEVKRFVTINEN